MREKSKLSAAVRVLVILLAAGGLIWTNLSVYVTAGSVIGSVVFGVIIAAAVFANPLKRLIIRLWKLKPGKAAISVIGAVIIAAVGFLAYFSVNMICFTEKPSDNVKCVLVLGCQVRGETPSSMLRTRLDAAIELLEEYPQAVCVVSGGQGKGESISEAEAMQRYLTANGIEQSRILCEDKSASTNENMAFSAELIRPLNVSGGELSIVTSDFHQFRADILAARYGFENAAHHSARTPMVFLLNNLFREWAALFAVHFGF
ncbi:MAG: YdcF family protein [Oscillospiraceae bacterium]